MPIHRAISASRAGRTARRPRPIWRARSIVALALLLFGIVLGTLFIVNAYVPAVHASPTRYGPDPAKVSAAVQAAAWPQQQHVWCGVAAVAAVADFRGAGVSQSAVADAMSSQSEWGTPGPSGDSWGPGFKADIARDGGADPRAHAAALAQVTHAGYHEAVDYTGPWTATTHLVADLLRAQEPIVAIVEHGAHSVVVAGVYANGDPHNLNNVTDLDVWDPGVGSVDSGTQQYQEEVVPLGHWLYWWSYWGETYDANWSGGRMLDPDPGVGPYTYDPNSGRDQHLWIGHFVYIRPDASGEATNGISPDWAFNQNVALIRGFNGEVPAGYAGPSVALYTPPPPPPPTPTPLPTATPTPAPTWTPHGAVIDPTQPWENETVTVSTPTAVAKPTPAAGSPLSFSLQQVCIGSNCTPGAAWALGGGFLLAAALLMLAGVFLIRLRSRKATPAPTPAPVPAVAMPGGVFTEVETVVPESLETAGESAAEVANAPGQAEDAAPEESQQEARDEAEDAGERAPGPLARLAGAAARLDGLADGLADGSAEGLAGSTAEQAAPPAETPGTSAGHVAADVNEEASQDLTLTSLAAEVAAEDAAQTAPEEAATASGADATATGANDNGADNGALAPAAVIPESERTS